MQLLKKVCVVIPIHRNIPTKEEKISIKRCFDILGHYDIFFLCPEKMEINEYTKLTGEKSYHIKYIDSYWQSSLKCYNKMKVASVFYRLFEDYQYMLTYEPDAYVFKDELSFWCEKGFDYIGAPFFNQHNKIEKVPGKQITGVGNSGFSLRNIQKCIQVLTDFEKYKRIAGFFDKIRAGFIFRGFFLFDTILPDRFLFKIRMVRAYLKKEYTHEDVFWAIFVPRLFPSYKVADSENALAFSFDANPSICFEMNGNKIPFGCHAWAKYDPNFWSPYIIKK